MKKALECIAFQFHRSLAMKLLDSRARHLVRRTCWARACALASDRAHPTEMPDNRGARGR